MPRRLVSRKATVECANCGTVLTVTVPPRAYVKHVHGRDLTEEATTARCVCGEETEVSVGQLFRAA